MSSKSAFGEGASVRVIKGSLHEKGFVLVFVLLLLSFALSVIMFTLFSSQIEKMAVQNETKTELARQNAKLALKSALDQLQLSAGPDQRITARADILDGENASTFKDRDGFTIPSTSIKNPYWTGVWSTGKSPLDISPTGGETQRAKSFGGSTPSQSSCSQSAIWLVSNPDPDRKIDPVSWSGITDFSESRNAVVLARDYGMVDSCSEVVAPLVPVQSFSPKEDLEKKQGGAYAYWVSDEGVKAKVNIQDRSSTLDPVGDLSENLLGFGVSQSMAGHKIFSTSSVLGSDFRDKETLPQVLTPQELPLVQEGELNQDLYLANRYLPDLTTRSYGVIVNVRQGGLKRDLTAAFEDASTPNKNYLKLSNDSTVPLGTGFARVYKAPDDTIPNTITAAASSTYMDGLAWHSLYSYYNLYKGVIPSPSLQGRTANSLAREIKGVGDSSAAARAYSISPQVLSWTSPFSAAGVGIDTYGVLSPIFLGFRQDITVSSSVIPGGYGLNLNYYPQVILFNPYAVRLHDPGNSFRMGFGLYVPTGIANSVGNDFYLTTNYNMSGPPVTPVSYQVRLMRSQLENKSSFDGRLTFSTSFNDTQTLDPGEIRIFSSSGVTTTFPFTGTTVGDGIINACSYGRESSDPYGMVSNGYSKSNKRVVSNIGYINTYGSVNSGVADTYLSRAAIPSGTSVKLSLTTTVNGLVRSNLATLHPICQEYQVGIHSMSQSACWPTLNNKNLNNAGTGSYLLYNVPSVKGSDGTRVNLLGVTSNYDVNIAVPSQSRPDTTVTVDSMGEKLVWSYGYRMKGLLNSLLPANTFASMGSKFTVPLFAGNSASINLFYGLWSTQPFNYPTSEVIHYSNLNTWQDYPLSNTNLDFKTASSGGYTTTSWGNYPTGEESAQSFQKGIILKDIPIQPMISLGQFMHISPHYIVGMGSYQYLPFGNCFVGGSLPSPEVPLDSNFRNYVISWPSNVWVSYFDHSFLSNQALFDSFFFSTVPPAAAPAGTTWPSRWTKFNKENDGTFKKETPLLNSRIVPYYREGNPPLLSDLRDMEKAAGSLLLNGAFNVNSTSVKAWKALLCSLGGSRLNKSGNVYNTWNTETRQAVSFSSEKLLNPIMRFWSANCTDKVNTRWSGIRAMTDEQMHDLALKIVEQVKVRGPFLSMADFLNRRLSKQSSQLSRAGALQAAIDHTSLNQLIKTGQRVQNNSIVGVAAPTGSLVNVANMMDASSDVGTAWDSAIGMPGYLMQQDLVQSFAPTLTVRSDTFVIRVYGESQNPKGKVEAQVWGEAVVQRVPDFFDTTQAPETELSKLNQTNTRYGRRFKVVGFRWINRRDI